MKKLITLLAIFSIVSQLWAVSPKPGSGLKHDGSIMPEQSSADGEYRAVALEKAVSTTGSKKLLVILANFTDYSFNTTYASESLTHNQAYYEKLLHDGSGLTVTKYYQQQSRGNLELSFQVLGPYNAAYGYAYYGANDLADNDRRPAVLVQEMLDKVEASGSASTNLDNCCVIIIHSGPGEEEGTTVAGPDFIWSHRSSLSRKSLDPVKITKTGKYFDDYVIVPEYTLWNNAGVTEAEATIGTICHEFGHILGLADAYDTSYATAGVGQWSLMGGGEWGTMGDYSVPAGADPAPLMGWELVKLGWITETNITPPVGTTKYYAFENMNDSSQVYKVNLGGNQYLTLEGKAKNLSGTGMAVCETGLLITHVHNGILEKYGGTRNSINSSSYRPHGSMVIEAVAENYKAKGLGNLWRGSSRKYRSTTTALFRAGNLDSVGPEKSSSADISFIPLFLSTIIGSGVVISILVFWYSGRKKLCAAIATAVAVACISFGCTISSGGGSSEEVYDKGPNTNYYTDMANVHSKTGYSGITIYNIQCNDDGSGSFYIKREQ